MSSPARRLLLIPLSAFTVLCLCGATSGDLVIHEWGTITTVHAADGTPAGELNRIDESDVLPDFIHRYEPESTRFDPKKRLMKAPMIPGRPDVTMRLETPVIYFHPGQKRHYETPIDVKVKFRGGVINEFYPNAEAGVALDLTRITDKRQEGVLAPGWTGEILNNYVVGSLSWKGVKLLDTVVAPLTNDPIWTAPREVQATSVFIPEAGEGERYLFYRGVGALPALFQTRLAGSSVRLSSPANLAWLEAPSVVIRKTWLIEVRPDKTIAFREQGVITLEKEKAGKEVAKLKDFGNGDFAPERLKELRASLKTALIRDGLYADEAEAMLNTWKHSYFEKPGLRVLYLVPRVWTDYFLPLEFSVAARVNRVIVGRVDINRE